jgi:hypothetical protein
MIQHSPEAAIVRSRMAEGKAEKGWSLVDNLVLFRGGGGDFIPEESTLWPELLSHTHAGHEGIQKTITRWRASFYSPQALWRVREFVRGCSVC